MRLFLYFCLNSRGDNSSDWSVDGNGWTGTECDYNRWKPPLNKSAGRSRTNCEGTKKTIYCILIEFMVVSKVYFIINNFLLSQKNYTQKKVHTRIALKYMKRNMTCATRDSATCWLSLLPLVEYKCVGDRYRDKYKWILRKYTSKNECSRIVMRYARFGHWLTQALCILPPLNTNTFLAYLYKTQYHPRVSWPYTYIMGWQRLTENRIQKLQLAIINQ